MVNDNTDVNNEVVAQEETAFQQPVEESEQQSAADDQERNWQKARQLIEEQKAQLAKEREKAQQFQKQLEQLARQQQAPQEPEEQLHEDDILTVKQAEKLAAKKFQQMLAQYEDAKAEEQMRSTYNDYNNVVNADTLQRVKELDPDLVEIIKVLPSLKQQSKLAYYLGKAYGIGGEDKESVQKNLSKPRSLNSVAPTPLSQANAFAKGLTPELKSALRAEMIEAAKRS